MLKNLVHDKCEMSYTRNQTSSTLLNTLHHPLVVDVKRTLPCIYSNRYFINALSSVCSISQDKLTKGLLISDNIIIILLALNIGVKMKLHITINNNR